MEADNDLYSHIEREGVTNSKYCYDKQAVPPVSIYRDNCKIELCKEEVLGKIWEPEANKEEFESNKEYSPPIYARVQGRPAMDFLAKNQVVEKCCSIDWLNSI